MRFLVQSDLHIEFGEDYIPPTDGYDAVILAGDTSKGTAGIIWAQEKWPDVPIIYLLGNHEYYDHSWETLLGEIKAQAGPNTHVLEMDEVKLGGVRILGTTLWSDMGGGDACWWLARKMRDYEWIKSESNPGGILEPTQTMARFAESKAWLAGKLAEPFRGQTIVVTHHAPSYRGCGWRQYGGFEPAYASDLESMVALSGASVWIHGHTHVAKRYMCGEVPVLSNARGYPRENSAGWERDCIIEVGPDGSKNVLPEPFVPQESEPLDSDF